MKLKRISDEKRRIWKILLQEVADVEFTRREQAMIVLIILLVIAVSSAVFWPKEDAVSVVTPPPPAAEQNNEPSKHKNIIVYVSGAVKHPGVVSMAPGEG